MSSEKARKRGRPRLETRCGRGHKRTEQDTYIRSSGQRVCRDCNREYQREFRRDHPEKSRAASEAWRKANPDRVAEYKRKWCEANPERVREASKRQWVRTKKAARAAVVERQTRQLEGLLPARACRFDSC